METYFYEAFENMERLGPGCKQSTLKAISFINKNKSIRILDIGCGVGTHTFLLAKQLPNATIIAIDNNQDYINQLNSKAKSLNLEDRVTGICMSMFEMTFADNSFDYIFAEGAIYIAGFTKGLSDWKRLLRKNGIIICSEISWIVKNPSEEIKAFWENGYSQMDSFENKASVTEEVGYKLVDSFPLPKEAWIENYYVPLQKNIDKMHHKYIDNKEALEVVNMIQQEIDLYYKYSDEYNYIFYILEKM